MAESETGKRGHRAGVFDIRTFIGALLGVYGVILTLTGLFATDDQQLAKTDDFNINLVAGIILIVASALFIAWARLRPVVVPHNPEDAHE
jgi:drug/metabolite transporter (DMT)-like permease